MGRYLPETLGFLVPSVPAEHPQDLTGTVDMSDCPGVHTRPTETETAQTPFTDLLSSC